MRESPQVTRRWSFAGLFATIGIVLAACAGTPPPGGCLVPPSQATGGTTLLVTMTVAAGGRCAIRATSLSGELRVARAPTNGSLAGRGGGTVVYTPRAGYVGPDRWSVHAAGGGLVEANVEVVAVPGDVIPTKGGAEPPADGPTKAR